MCDGGGGIPACLERSSHKKTSSGVGKGKGKGSNGGARCAFLMQPLSCARDPKASSRHGIKARTPKTTSTAWTVVCVATCLRRVFCFLLQKHAIIVASANISALRGLRCFGAERLFFPLIFLKPLPPPSAFIRSMAHPCFVLGFVSLPCPYPEGCIDLGPALK